MEGQKRIGISTAENFRAFTEAKLGTKLPDNTISAWISLARTIRVADDFVDNQSSEALRNHIYQTGINYLSGGSEKLQLTNDLLVQEMSGLRTHLDLLSPDSKAIFIRNLGLLLKVTERIKKTTDPRQLAQLSMLEGQVTSRLFLTFLPENSRSANGFREYTDYILGISRGINAFDTLVDLGEDFRQGRSLVKPSFRNKVIFAAAVMPNAVDVLIHTDPKFFKLFRNGVRTITQDRKGDSPIHFRGKDN